LAIKFKPYGFLKKSPPHNNTCSKNHFSRVVFFQKNLTASPRQQVNYFLFFLFLLKMICEQSGAEREERVQCTLLAKEPDGARKNFNCRTMSTFEIKTHQAGRTYSRPHFFILNRAERKETVR